MRINFEEVKVKGKTSGVNGRQNECNLWHMFCRTDTNMDNWHFHNNWDL